MRAHTRQLTWQGETRLLLTRIPLFKDVLVASFSCEHCGYSNNEIDYTGVIEPQGKKITFKVHSPSVSGCTAHVFVDGKLSVALDHSSISLR